MAALWAFGSVSLFISEKGSSREIKRAELFPLDSTVSSYQFFGAGSRHYNVKGIIVGSADYDTLESYAINNSPQTFTTPWGNVANAKIHGEIKATSVRYGGGTFDGVSVSAATTELIEVELEIIY